MRRPALPWVVVLAALTSVALLSTAVALRGPGAPAVVATAADTANSALAYRFYEAANDAIVSGDPTGLTAVVADDFVDATAAPDAEPDREALIRRLLLLHELAPDLRVVAEAVATDGDLVVAQTRVDGAVVPMLFGLHLDSTWIPWGPVDVFRIVGGRIGERRGPALDPVPVIPGLRVQVALDLPPPNLQALLVARITLQPGARYVAPTLDGPRLLVSETGAVAVDASHGSPPGHLDTSSHELGGGDHVTLPPRTGVVATNRGTVPVALLDVTIAAVPFTDAAPRSSARSQETGVRVEHLADELLVDVPARPAMLTIGRFDLSSDARLGWTAGEGPILLHVDAGDVVLAATGESPWISTGAGERSPAGVQGMLAAGDGILLSAGAAVDVRAGAHLPATVLIVTLLPAEPRSVARSDTATP